MRIINFNMKNILVFSILFAVTILNAQITKTINVTVAGTLTTLLSASEKSTITNLAITGTIDAVDFQTMRDQMPSIAVLDISAVNIAALNDIWYPRAANEIPESAFTFFDYTKKYSNLKTVSLPLTATSIGRNAFNSCTGLTTVNIPASVTTIIDGAFWGCTALSSITIHAPTPPTFRLYELGFEGVNKTTCKLYVPVGTLNAYKAANQWKDFVNVQEIGSGEPQDGYLIQFKGSGDASVIDSVEVNNLTQNKKLLIKNGNSLRLKSTNNTNQVGAEQLMNYQSGDRLLIKGYSGKLCTILTDIPTGGKTVNFEFVTCKDADGNYYATVKIGGQIWMAENLRTTKYRNGEAIPLLQSDTEWTSNTEGKGKYCRYNQTVVVNGQTIVIDGYNEHGLLYDVKTVYDKRNIAPEGWHVAIQEDWNTLINFLGGSSVAGTKLKDSGVNYWNSNYKTNESGFTGRAGGARRYDGSFENINGYGYWWIKTDSYKAMMLTFSSPNISGINPVFEALSIRCVKDPTSAKYVVSATASPAEGGTLKGGGLYAIADISTVEAAPNYGYKFSNWTENGVVVSNLASYSFIVSGNRTLVAIFIEEKTATDLTSGLVAYYPFNGNANDESGNGNNGTVNGAMLTTDRFGNVEKAYRFDGNSSNIQLSSNVFNDLVSGSIYAKVILKKQGIQQAILDKTITGTTNYFQFIIDVNNKLRVIFNDQYFIGNSLLQSNTYYDVACTFNGQSLKLYINGQLDAEFSCTQKLLDANRTIFIGKVENNTAYMNGNIDEYRIYNRALSVEEIQELYKLNDNSNELVYKLNVTEEINIPAIVSTNTIHDVTVKVSNAANGIFKGNLHLKIKLSETNEWSILKTISAEIASGITQSFTFDDISINHSAGDYDISVFSEDSDSHTTVIAGEPLSYTIKKINITENSAVKTINIVTLVPNINDLTPANIKESGSLYLHYQITDALNNPVRGIKIRSKLGTITEPIYSSVSDDSGIVQIKVSVWGKDMNDKSDDLIPVYDNKTLTFVAALDDNNNLMKVNVNKYLPRVIGVLPYCPIVQSGTFTTSLGKKFDKINTSVKAGPSFDFNYYLSETGEIEKMSYTSNFLASGGVKFDFKLKDFETNAGVKINYLNNTKVKMKDDPRAYIIALYNMFSADNFVKSSNSMFFMSALADMIQNDQNPLQLESQSGQKVGVKIDAGVKVAKNEISQSLGGNLMKVLLTDNLNVNGSLNYGYSWGKTLNSNSVQENYSKHAISLGIKIEGSRDFGHEIYEQLSNGWRQYDLFSDSKPLNIAIEAVRESDFAMTSKKMTGFANNNGLSLEYGLTNEVSLNTENVEMKLKNEDYKVDGGISFAKQTTSETVVGEKMLDYLNKSTSIEVPFTISTLKNTDGEIFSLYNTFSDASSIEKFITKELDSESYTQTESTIQEDCKKTIEKENSINFNAGLPVKIGNWKFDFEAALELKYKFPLLESYYHVNTKKMLPVFIYNDFDDESNINDINVLNTLWKNIQNSVVELKDVILEKLKSIGNQIVQFVGDTITTFTNTKRSYSKSLVRYKQLNTNPQQSFSRLEFTIPGNQKAFATNTRFEFMYFYTGGEVIGRTVQNDSILIISDVFYLQAISGADTLKTAPNGNFSLKSTVGIEDLTLFSLNLTTPVYVYYKPVNDVLWNKIGDANTTIDVNGLGNYTLGISLNSDQIVPQISINKEYGSKEVSVQITDNLGINWNSVSITCNGSVRSFTRNDNGMLTVLLTDEEYMQELFVTVSVSDIAQNRIQVQKSFNMNTGLLYNKEKIQFSVYPNPAKSFTTISSTETIERIELCDISGRTIQNYTINSTTYLLDLQNLTKGVYLIKGFTEGRVKVGRFVKE
jgi:uncharacterized protein (TIGR02145 family)